jgi:hypothetical protein
MLTSHNNDDGIETISNYQNICSQFIIELSGDYISWIERYNLEKLEDTKRRKGVEEVIKKTNNWIYKYGNSIKKIDIIMNDGINKMAETTAGYPFKFDINIGNLCRYTYHRIGEIKLKIKAIPRSTKLVRIGKYDDKNTLLVNSSSEINYHISRESFELVDIIDDYIILDAKNGLDKDVISVTVIAEECRDNFVSERRGYSTIIVLNQNI